MLLEVSKYYAVWDGDMSALWLEMPVSDEEFDWEDWDDENLWDMNDWRLLSDDDEWVEMYVVDIHNRQSLS